MSFFASIKNTILNKNQPSLNKYIKSAFLSKGGLYPHELLLLSYAEKYKFNQKSFDNFWLDDYNITNKKLQSMLKSLVKREFLKIGSIEISLKNSKVEYIKQILKENNLKVSGKKSELISRLINNISESSLKNYFPEEFYSLTQKGQEELNDNSYIEYIKNKSYCNLTIWEANTLLNQNPSFSIADISWRKLNDECSTHFKSHNFGLYRNTRYTMAMQLIDEQKLEKALCFLFEVCYWDLSSINNNIQLEHLSEHIENSMKYFFPYENTSLEVNTYIINQIKEISEQLDLSIEELKFIYNEALENINPLFHVFTKDECLEIILNKITNKNITKAKQIYRNAKSRLKQQYN